MRTSMASGRSGSYTTFAYARRAVMGLPMLGGDSGRSTTYSDNNNGWMQVTNVEINVRDGSTTALDSAGSMGRTSARSGQSGKEAGI